MNKKNIVCCLAISFAIFSFTPNILYGSVNKKPKHCIFKLRQDAGERLELFFASIELMCAPITFIHHWQSYTSPDWLTSLINYSAKHNLTKLFKFLYPLHCKLTHKALPTFAYEKKSALHYTVENQNKELFNIIIDSWDRYVSGKPIHADLLEEDSRGNAFLHWLAQLSKKNKKLIPMIDYAIKTLFNKQEDILIYGLDSKNLNEKSPVDLASNEVKHLFQWPTIQTNEEVEKYQLPGPSDDHFEKIIAQIKNLSFEEFVKLTNSYSSYFYKLTKNKKTLLQEAFNFERFDICEFLNQKGCELSLNNNEKATHSEEFKRLYKKQFQNYLGNFIRLCAINYKLINNSKTHGSIKKRHFCDTTFKFEYKPTIFPI